MTTQFPHSSGPDGLPAQGFPVQGAGPAQGFPGPAGFGAPAPGPSGFGAPAPAPGGFGGAADQPEAAPAPKGRRGEKAARSPKSGGRAQKAGKAPKTARKKLVTKQVGLALVAAMVAAGGGVMLLAQPEELTYVVRSQAAMATGTSVSANLLEAVPLPVDAIEPGALTASTAEEALAKALEDLEGVVTQYPIPAKSQVHVDQFGVQTTLGAEMSPTDRLVSVEAKVSNAVAGSIVPGDLVDVVGSTGEEARYVAYNVKVVAVTVGATQFESVANQQTEDKNVTSSDALPGKPVPGIYTLRVPAELVPQLSLWHANSTLSLVYRGTGAETVEGDPVLITDEPADALESVDVPAKGATQEPDGDTPAGGDLPEAPAAP